MLLILIPYLLLFCFLFYFGFFHDRYNKKRFDEFVILTNLILDYYSSSDFKNLSSEDLSVLITKQEKFSEIIHNVPTLTLSNMASSSLYYKNVNLVLIELFKEHIPDIKQKEREKKLKQILANKKQIVSLYSQKQK